MQIDLLQEITQSPRILSEVDAAVRAKQMKADIDEYLKVQSHSLLIVIDLQMYFSVICDFANIFFHLILYSFTLLSIYFFFL